jgi:Cyclin-dependent kinase regulatory subunit
MENVILLIIFLLFLYSSTTIRYLYRRRHVILPKELAKTLPKSRLLTENEWRAIGVQQSRGWQHYAIHRYVPCNFELIYERTPPSQIYVYFSLPYMWC